MDSTHRSTSDAIGYAKVRIDYLENRVMQLETLVRDLLDRIEFMPDGPVAQEAVEKAMRELSGAKRSSTPSE